MGLGGMEWVIIILVVLLLFGAKKIPELARGVGQGINEFRRASSDIKKELDRKDQENDAEYRHEQQHRQYSQDQQSTDQQSRYQEKEASRPNQA